MSRDRKAKGQLALVTVDEHQAVSDRSGRNIPKSAGRPPLPVLRRPKADHRRLRTFRHIRRISLLGQWTLMSSVKLYGRARALPDREGR